MIVAALSDLMFISRIATAASAAGADVQVARTVDDVVARARQLKPGLLLLDLDCRTFDPLATLARLKSDPELSAIPVVGFVSHVEADVIAAARASGIDEVLARSAFVARLPEMMRKAAEADT
jgi:CheY-like chemotaxis protein